MNQNQMVRLNQWLGRLEPSLVLDQDGFCPLRLGATELGIQITRDGGLLYFFGDLVAVQRGRDGLLRQALEANYFQADSFGGWLAIDPQRHVVVLQRVLPMDSLNGDLFVDYLMAFSTALQTAKSNLMRAAATSVAAPVPAAERGLPFSGFA